MRVRLALVGCAAFSLVVPTVAADFAPPAGSEVVATATTSNEFVANPDGSATRDKAINFSKRYTLTMTYTADREYRRADQRSSTDTHELRSYTASSVRPFTFTRSGDVFSFTAPMKGAFQQVGRGSGWSIWDQDIVTYESQWGAKGPMSGEVHLLGSSPARVITEMRSPTDQQGTVTVRSCSTGGCQTSTHGFSTGFADRSWSRRVNLSKAFGHAFTVVDRSTTTLIDDTTTHAKWRFRFTPVAEPAETQRWQVEVRGQDRWSWGMYTGLRGGVDVDWAHRTTLVVKDGELISAKGKVQIIDVRPFSEPPGAFSITHKTTTPPAYRLKKAVKRGNRVELGLWKVGGSEYLVKFAIRAAGPQLLDQLRIIGVPDPEATYQAVLARGTIQDSAAPMVPNSPRLVVQLRPYAFPLDTDAFNNQLPCLESGANEQDCFLTKGGQGVTVTKLN